MRMSLKSLLAATATCALAWAAPVAAQNAPTEAPAAVTALDPVKAVPAVKDVDPALWVIKDEDTTIYLFGSIHVLKPGLGWFDDGVKTAFDSSDQLVLELVDLPAAETQALFGKLAMDQQGKTLRSKMNDADRAVYDAAMGKLGIPAPSFDPFEPWAAGIAMSLMAIQKSGYEPNSGVETQLTAAAKVSKKPIVGLETAEFQLGIFDTLPEADQIAFLVETAKTIDDTNSMMEKMVNMWGSADTESLAQLMNEGLTSRTLYDAVLTNRNANWAKWISAQMKKPGVTFMAVGAGHLAGPTSVQALLPTYGLTATRVAY
ncbi:TraB/GumN family protein [Sphingorhabdus sp.]|uniref:TraB/GumN family protein n=1 Tax=Sphingorhabdus sp. TaxID=1902408 RepID=UPI0025D2FA10|nr:TraB/GumN family protein [Sphingorhabdus sp.]